MIPIKVIVKSNHFAGGRPTYVIQDRLYYWNEASSKSKENLEWFTKVIEEMKIKKEKPKQVLYYLGLVKYAMETNERELLKVNTNI
jgi:hypothetical protein